MQNALNIIDSLIDKIEFRKYEEVPSSYFLPPCIEFLIYTDSSKVPEIVKINQDLRVSNLKILLSNIFKINKSKIVVKNFISRRELDNQYDNKLSYIKTDNKLLVEFKKN